MTQPANNKTILVIEAPYYRKITDGMIEGATPILTEAGYGIERLVVPGAFEIPAACEMAIQRGLKDPHLRYAGILAFGCVIRGETTHYDHICNEVSRAIMDLTIHHRFAIGFGVLTCESMDQAEVRADPARKNKGGEAARAVVRMIDVRRHFQGREDGK